jgi:CO/xanthine dehydrogenase Mo-binding subunit
MIDLRENLDRRSFLQASLTAAGGLLVSVYVDLDPNTLAGAEPFVPNGFVRIDPDGTVTIYQKSPDMGQGVKTAMPMIVADELDADWSRVRVEQAPLDPKRYGGQGSGGSDNIISDWMRLREAGAAARAMLVSAAAARWEVSRESCRTDAGFVINVRSGQRISYGELAAQAAEMPVPQRPFTLKDPRDFRIIGTRVRGVDTPSIVTGRPLYGLDVRVPGMLFAAAVHPPVFGATLRAVDSAGALKIPGVRHVVPFSRHENRTWLRDGIAVVGDTTWAAFKGRDALAVTWDEPAGPLDDTDALEAKFRELASGTGKVLREAGDVDGAIAAAAHRVDAMYEGPFVAHATLEPQNCTAHYQVSGGVARCEVWGPVQMPMSAQQVVAAVTGLPREQVTVHMTRVGGGFGRRLLSDYAAEAAVVSKAIGKPVQVVWSREEDLSQDYYRPSNAQRVRAAVDAGGAIVAWDHHVAGVSRNSHRGGTPPEGTEIYGLLAPPAPDHTADLESLMRPVRIPNMRTSFSEVPTRIPTGAWRAPSHSFHAFVIESVIDELAARAGLDPVDLRLRMIGSATDIRVKEPSATQYNPDRLKRVLLAVANRANWQRGAAAPQRTSGGIGRGIACHFTFSGYSAQVVEASVEDNRIRIHRIVAALDVGTPVNPLGLEAQTQGGIIDGLSAALYGRITVRGGRVEQKTFADYPLLRHDQAPPIEVVILPSTDPPVGYGEIALPPLAPALANAIFAATGRRIRRLPLVRDGLTL